MNMKRNKVNKNDLRTKLHKTDNSTKPLQKCLSSGFG